MGKVFSVAKRKAMRFNVENRAHKVISMEKPVPAPKHPSSQREIDMLVKDHADAFQNLQKRDQQLNENLKQVFVTSAVDEMSKFGKPSDKSRLPMNRTSHADTEFGYEEPEIILRGKITLKQALRVLADRSVSVESVSAQKIADALNISLKDAENLVNYFSSLKIHMPEGVPLISTTEKARRMLARQISQTKVISGDSGSPLQLDDSSKNKPG